MIDLLPGFGLVEQDWGTFSPLMKKEGDEGSFDCFDGDPF